MTIRATWGGAVLAESDATIVVEGNHYFPPGAVVNDLTAPSDKHTSCPLKGEANYFDIVVDGQRNAGAAWYYPDPKPAAAEIRDYVAFWKGVTVAEA